MKVLIVDDEEDIRSIAALGLSRVGQMDVIEASGGRDGVERARAESPDVILLDVMMPEVDGPSTLRALQSDPTTREIPVVFLTAKAMPAEVARLRKLGARGVLTKPFDPLALPGQVRAVLSTQAPTDRAEHPAANKREESPWKS